MSIEKLNKKQVEEKIESFFADINNKTPEQVRKIKKLAMAHRIKLKYLRKKFCQKCYSTKLKVVGIKKGMKTVKCENGHVMRWRIK